MESSKEKVAEDITEDVDAKDSKSKLAPGTIEDFANLDIRVGKILDVWNNPESTTMYCEKIDIGFEVREIGTGVRSCIPIEKVEGLVLVMANLRPKKCGSFVSNGMVLCAGNKDDTLFEFLRPPQDAKVGERVTVEGYDKILQEQGKTINSKKKYLEKSLPAMRTDSEGYATFQGKKWTTSAGYIKVAALVDSQIT